MNCCTFHDILDSDSDTTVCMFMQRGEIPHIFTVVLVGRVGLGHLADYPAMSFVLVLVCPNINKLGWPIN